MLFYILVQESTCELEFLENVIFPKCKFYAGRENGILVPVAFFAFHQWDDGRDGNLGTSLVLRFQSSLQVISPPISYPEPGPPRPAVGNVPYTTYLPRFPTAGLWGRGLWVRGKMAHASTWIRVFPRIPECQRGCSLLKCTDISDFDRYAVFPFSIDLFFIFV